MRPEFIPVGQIVNAHGIRGEVKLNPAGFDPAFLAAFDTLYIGGKETKVKSARVHKSTVLLVLPGVEDMDAALALKGKPVFIRRTDAHLPEGEYFDAELEGLTVLDDENGEEAHPCAELSGPQGLRGPGEAGVSDPGGAGGVHPWGGHGDRHHAGAEHERTGHG